MCPMNYTMPPRRGIGSWCLIIPLSIVGAIFLLRSLRSANYDAPATAIIATPAPDAYEPPQAPDPSEVLLADVYPSQESAVAALSRKLPSAITQVESNPQLIVISCPDGAFESRRVRNLIARDFSSATVSDQADGVDDSKALKLNLQISNEGVFAGNPPHHPLRGKVQIDIEGPIDRTTLSARFIDRPWAADSAAYINDHPDRNTIIGRCTKVCLSEPEARRIAEEDAMRQAVTLIQRHANNRGANFTGRAQDTARLLADLRRGMPVQDRFVQKYHRPYGDVWSESVLVDASNGWLESMSQRHATVIHQHEMRAKGIFASVLVVLITIVIAYLFLNAVTKSYFTARLRFIAIMLAVVVMVAAMGLISHA
jgi:hypothetical protein